MCHNIKQLRMVYNVFNISEILQKEIWYGPQSQTIMYGIICTVFNIPGILRKEIWYGPQYQTITYGIQCI